MYIKSAVNDNLRRIGAGFCGSVWAPPTGSQNAHSFKREDGGPGRSVYNDYVMHQKVLSALSMSLSANQSKVHVPGCHEYVRADNQLWWDRHLPRFPEDHQKPCNVLVTDRIPPFPQAVRDSIINMYCPESLRPSIRASEPDRDCLIRPYLGRRRRLERQSRFNAFSLRNYPLHIDQVKELALPATLYARIMAETLADLYWKAHVDANDVEFVLAPPRAGRPAEPKDDGAHPSMINSHILGDHAVWLLDFDCCRDMSMDEAGVEQAAAAFCRNDPYHPRPKPGDPEIQELWEKFKERFLEASGAILGTESPEARLPALWVELVEGKCQPRVDAGTE